MVVVGNIKISRTALIGAVKCHGCKTKFAETTQKPNSGLSCGAGSMPRRNEIHHLLWHQQRRPGQGEREDGEEVQRW